MYCCLTTYCVAHACTTRAGAACKDTTLRVEAHPVQAGIANEDHLLAAQAMQPHVTLQQVLASVVVYVSLAAAGSPVCGYTKFRVIVHVTKS